MIISGNRFPLFGIMIEQRSDGLGRNPLRRSMR